MLSRKWSGASNSDLSVYYRTVTRIQPFDKLIYYTFSFRDKQ